MSEKSELKIREKKRESNEKNEEPLTKLKYQNLKKQSQKTKLKERGNETLSNWRPSARKGEEEIEQVHEPMKNGAASSVVPINNPGPSFLQQRVPKKNEGKIALVRGEKKINEEASTSLATQRSILRENNEPANDNFVLNRFFRFLKLWTRNPASEKKSILFIDARESKDSLESIVTIIGTPRPLKSALRNGDSIRSENSSSVRFSLPPTETTGSTINDNKKLAVFKIANWNIVCEIADDSDDQLHIFHSICRTRFCKIFMCFTLGVIVPSFLIVPVLVYVDDSNY